MTTITTVFGKPIFKLFNTFLQLSYLLSLRLDDISQDMNELNLIGMG